MSDRIRGSYQDALYKSTYTTTNTKPLQNRDELGYAGTKVIASCEESLYRPRPIQCVHSSILRCAFRK